MISIVVPVYNVEKYIVKCLESIVNQSYKDFELLLINDGSTDNSVEVINKYLNNQDINWKLINKNNSGQSSTRNYGLDRTVGDYVTFIDSDDVINKDFLKVLYLKVLEKDYDFSFCNFKYVKQQIPPNERSDKYKEYSRAEMLNVFLKRTVNFVVPSMLFKKEFLINNAIRFNEKIRFSEDQMFIWDVLYRCNKCIYINDPLYGYYLREKSIMTSSPFEKIVDSYKVYSDFCDKIVNAYPNDYNVSKLILPRWQLGTLYSAAKLVDYNQFYELCTIMHSKTLFIRLLNINEITAYMLSFVFMISSRIAYLLCKRMNK